MDLTKTLPPPPAIQLLAKLAIMRHLAPAVASPFASRHIHHKVAVLLVVEDAGVARCLGAGARGERIDHALRDERSAGSDPGLVGVEVLLLLVSIFLSFFLFFYIMGGN